MVYIFCVNKCQKIALYRSFRIEKQTPPLRILGFSLVHSIYFQSYLPFLLNKQTLNYFLGVSVQAVFSQKNELKVVKTVLTSEKSG